jgi:excisionase family DNA binding protein
MIFYTRNEVAIYLRVHPRTVERWLQQGKIKGHKLGDSKTSLWRISKKEVEHFLAVRERVHYARTKQST